MSCVLAVVALPLAAPSPGSAATSIYLTTTAPAGQQVGATMTWTAHAAGQGSLLYRFDLRSPHSYTYKLIRDFSPTDSVALTPLQDGNYRLRLEVKQGWGATPAIRGVTAFTVASRVTGATPTVTAMPNPLIALYSAPACSTGYMKVVFRAATDAFGQSTNWQSCGAGQSLNFLVAGMRANTAYIMSNVVYNGSTVTWSPITTTFTTGSPSTALTFPAVTVPQPLSAQASLSQGVLFSSMVPFSGKQVTAMATDLSGRLLWYYDRNYWSNLAFPYPTRLLPGGTILMLGGEGGHSNNVIREVDLAGDPIHETNMDSVNAQLAAKGYEKILGFHHDAIRLPNGDTAVLGYVMRQVPGAGAHGDDNVIGDMLIVLDTNWQVAWAWDAFDNLPYRAPVLGETCFVNYLTYCPVSDPSATDWLHTNAISYSPTDGNLTLSLRDQDWVIKVAYQNGAGDGHVIWRLGPGGDFRLGAADASLWFSHQHDAHYLDNTTIGLFDNGNTRCHNAPQPCDSRGQILTVDEQNMVVTPTVSADMGAYSDVFGSAERLANGNYAFTSGYQMPGPSSNANEVNPSGTRVYSQQLVTDVYRGYRFKNLYSASLTSS